MNELKNFRFDVKITKASNDKTKTNDFYVEGYASTSDLDRQGDIVCKEALQKAARSLETVNDTVFYGHEYDLNNAVGKIVKADADDIGLKVKIYVSEWAEELRMKLKEGIINKFSIGGRVSKDRQISLAEAVTAGLVEENTSFEEINVIEDIDLFEVSFVGVPANPKAGVIRTLSKALHSTLKGGENMAKVKKDVVKAPEDTDVIKENKEVETVSDVDAEQVIEKSEVEVPVEAIVDEVKAEVEPEAVVEPEANVELEVVADVAAEIKEEVELKEVDEAAVPEKVELSSIEIKELIDANAEDLEEDVEKKVEVEVNYLKKEDISSMESKIDELTKKVDALQTMINDKVKSIDALPAKKSVIKGADPLVTKKVKEIDAEEDFLNIIQGKK